MSKKNPEFSLNDLADDLFVLNKITIDKLFNLDKPAEPLALYIFYYKTAKWQKTNRIKANDMYVRKSLKWGANKVTQTKQILKDMGLIKVVQTRKNNQVAKWFIEISYIVSKEKSYNTQTSVVEQNSGESDQDSNNTQTSVVGSKNTREQEHSRARTLKRETNALKGLDKVLKENREEIFSFWIKTFKKTDAVLDESRITTIDKSLKHYSTNDIKNAIIGCSLSDWHMGVRPASKDGVVHDSLSMILRDAEQVEKFISLSGSKSKAQKVIPSLGDVTEQLLNVYVNKQERNYTHPIVSDIENLIQRKVSSGFSFGKEGVFRQFIADKYAELNQVAQVA